MKSLMEEASSISKAIENAWKRAGNPQEFSVKILELPRTSFFGLKTAKFAKVALFFAEGAIKVKEQHPARPARPAGHQQNRPAPSRSAEQPESRPSHAQPRRVQQGQTRPERTPELRPTSPRPESRPHQGRPERSTDSAPHRSEQRRPERNL